MTDSLPSENLNSSLFIRAKDFNLRAIREHINGDNTHSLVSMAISAELLGKSYLAGIHPSLIADLKDFDSLLTIVGAGAHSKRPIHDVKTISATEVFSRCQKLLPSLSDYKTELEKLANIRNGIVHVGLYDTVLAEKLFVPYLKHTKAIINAMELTNSEFHGDHTKYVEQTIEGSSESIRNGVARLIEKSKGTFAKRFGELEPDLMAKLLESVVATYAPSSSREQLLGCPACGTKALVRGLPIITDYDADFDQDGNVISATPIAVLHLNSLRCKACDLSLTTIESLQAAGVPTILDDVIVDPWDHSDPQEDFEPYYPQENQ